MASWWERDPAALAAEIKELTDAGFRVHREIASGARLALTVERDAETYRIVYYHADTRGGTHLVGFRPWPDPEVAVVSQGTAASAIVRFREGKGTRIFDRVAGCVYVPQKFRNRVTGAGGIVRLGRSRVIAGSYALRALTGSSAHLEVPDPSHLNAFPDGLNGLWARGEIADIDRLGAEQAVSAVEEIVACAHGLDAQDLRDRRQHEMLAVLRSRYGGDVAEWTFVRRDESGAPLLLTTDRWQGLDDSVRAPFARRLVGKRVSIIGCGAVGWTLALELARSGVSDFVLYDDDLVRTHNLPRLDTYMGAAGRFKVDVLAEQLHAIAPDIKVTYGPFEVGTHVGTAGLVTDRPDLIINVTGEEISTDESNAAALILDRPAIFAWVSNGVYAGRILRVRPGESACYDCIREAEPFPIRTSGPAPIGAENPWTGACDKGHVQRTWGAWARPRQCGDCGLLLAGQVHPVDDPSASAAAALIEWMQAGNTIQPPRVAAWMRDFRTERGLEECADHFGWVPTTVLNIESGAQRLQFSTVLRLVERTDLTADDLHELDPVIPAARTRRKGRVVPLVDVRALRRAVRDELRKPVDARQSVMALASTLGVNHVTLRRHVPEVQTLIDERRVARIVRPHR